jgi:hypothetical protein
MTHPETAIAALFDHEQETDAPVTGRKRPAPDWGGDELFSSTPRRRRIRDTGDHRVATPAHDEWSVLRARAERAVAEERAGKLSEPAPVAARPAPAVAAVSPREVEFAPIEKPAGRRTVTITGNPEPRIPRTRRPAPTVDQRIGHRPDRIAGWAFALGMLLILIAIVTAHAG